MEAIFARSVDMTYVGPNPAVNAHLKSRGEEIRIVAGACSGGAALVVPTANPDQLSLFQNGTMDAVWTVEPWVSRLVLETKGKIYFDESSLWTETGGKYVTTHLVSSVRFLK